MHIRTLEDLCIDNLFYFLYKFILTYPQEYKLYVRNITLPERVSQKMLKRILSVKDYQIIIPVFSSMLSSISNITIESDMPRDFQFLHLFNLVSFSSRYTGSECLEEFLEKFNETTQKKIKYLKLRKVKITNFPFRIVRQLINLKFLDLSKTDITGEHLTEICSSLPSIIGLNLSGTKIENLSALSLLSDRLEFLDIHYLSSSAYHGLFVILNPMTKLRYLDVSQHENFDKSFEIGHEQVLLNSRFLHSIRLIDISGCQNLIRFRTILALLRKTSQLKTFVCHPEATSNYFYRTTHRIEWKRFIRENPRITFIGPFSKSTILNGLIYCLDHRRYLTTVLHLLFDRTKNRSFFNETLNETIIRHMQKMQPENHDWLIAITAVVYNLTKGCLAEKWSVEQLSELVRLLIDYLDQPNASQQLVVNSFLIICNDFVIQHARYDKLRLSQLVFNGMRVHDIDNINQAGVIIISVIASELTKLELCQLVADDNNFQILLTLICRKCVLQSDLSEVSDQSYLSDVRATLRQSGEPIFDFILKFALSSLWNLTDECTAACKKFVEQEGLFVYFIMIDRFKNALPNVNSHIYNKCLGLLNNIAEEEECRSALLTKHYLDFLSDMLVQDDIQMTYFAGGILSNLLLISNDEWKGRCEYEKSVFENRIYSAVDTWVTPIYLMASYRSFSPFENLIANAGSSRAILLWSLWAIRHTMRIERKRYSTIFDRHPGLIEYVETLSKNKDHSYNRIRALATDILILHTQDIGHQMMVE